MGQVQVSDGSQLATNSLVPGFTVNGTLRHEEYIQWEDRLVQVARQRLNVIQDLRSAGLVKQLSGLGTTVSNYEKVSDMTAAEISMDGSTKSSNDRATFSEAGVPVPMFHKDFYLNKRTLESSRKLGESLDTTQIATSTRLVSDSLESMVFNGTPGLFVDGKTVYGLTNHPNTISQTLSGSGWAVKTGRDIIGDTEAMLSKAYADNFFGPFNLYVAKNIWAAIQGDYSDNKGDRTFKERIEAFSDIAAVKSGDFLANDSVVLVQMTEDVIDLVVGQDITSVEYGYDPMVSIFKVYSAMAVRVKSDFNNKLGVVHGAV